MASRVTRVGNSLNELRFEEEADMTTAERIERAGFRLVHVMDTTESAATISKRWHLARETRKAELIALEGNHNFAGLQRFLSCVHNLTAERRLLRYLYAAAKPS